jgi:Geranylgeranyl pyrophosphate synthase
MTMITNSSSVPLEDMIRIHIGQATDIGWHRGLRDPETVGVEHYLEMCANKTGVLPRMAARFAAIAADLSEEEERRIGKFAESIGGSSRVDLQACKLGTGRRFTTS